MVYSSPISFTKLEFGDIGLVLFGQGTAVPIEPMRSLYTAQACSAPDA